MRIILVLILFVFQVTSVASVGKLLPVQILFGSSHINNYSDNSQEIHAHDHEFDDHSRDISTHKHTHRHSPEESDHSHSHNHFGGNCQVTCLLSDVTFNLIPFLDPDLVFPLSDDIVAQSPFLSSVFRPPIV